MYIPRVLISANNLFFYSWRVYGVQGGVLKALDFNAIFISLATVISAILLGLTASYKMPQCNALANRLGTVSGVCLILVSIFFSSGQESNFWSQPWSFYIAVALPCAGGVLLANFFSSLLNLKKPEQVAISIECCYQNIGIATSVVVNMFDDPQERAAALSVPLFYGFLEAVLVGCYCVGAWKLGWTKAPADEKLCVVLTRTYEAESIEADDDADEHGTVPPHLGRRDSEEPLTLEEQEEFRASSGSAVTGWRAWLQAPFIPRYPDHFLSSPVETVPTCAPKSEETDRSRLVSEDYTVTTSGTDSPPNTPGGSELLSAQPVHIDLSPFARR